LSKPKFPKSCKALEEEEEVTVSYCSGDIADVSQLATVVWHVIVSYSSAHIADAS